MTTVHDFIRSIPERSMTRLNRASRGLFESLLYGLPLFEREMLEQSHRSRTFVLRAVFACAMFFVALCYSSASSGTSLLTTAFGMTGQGRIILDALVWMLFLAIYLFGPALACGALTAEKERNSLILLYLTRLGPWQVVIEKFLSRLVPSIGLLLLALPLLAFAYAFGGLTQYFLGLAVWFLLLCAIQVTAVSVMSSAICRSTANAFLLTYVLLFVFSFGFDLTDHWVFHDWGYDILRKWESDAWLPQSPSLLGKTYEMGPTIVLGQLSGQTMTLSRPALVNTLCGPMLYTSYAYGAQAWVEHTQGYVTFYYRQIPVAFSLAALAGIPILISSCLCLIVARVFVFRHANENVSPGIFALIKERCGLARREMHLDQSLSDRMTALANMPSEGDPIAWRESTKGFIGRPVGTILILLGLEIPTVVVLLFLMSTSSPFRISQLILSIWAVSTLLITVHASMLVTKERSRQTLDLLLTTPLTSAEIAQQKFAGTRRLILLCAVPLLTCIAFQAWWRSVLPLPVRVPAIPPFDPLEYALTSLACIAIYLPTVGWIALWMGMKFQHPTRATMAAIGAIATFCLAAVVVLLIIIAFLTPIFGASESVPLIVTSTSPIAMLYAVEFVPLPILCSIPYLPILLNMSVCGLVYWNLRRKVLEQADCHLGRTVTY